jgi:hypothetical protein
MNSNRSRRIAVTLGTAAGGLLAVGLAIGAALASTPGVASADDFQISIDGFDLFPSNTATATSGLGDIAIAIGNGADATATGGIFDFAFADGASSLATSTDSKITSYGGNFDFAFADGDGSSTSVGGGSFDAATGIGTDARAGAGSGDFDSATAIGNNNFAGAGIGGSGDLTASFGNNIFAFAGGGNGTVAGNGDLAFVVNTGSAEDQAVAGSTSSNVAGTFDIASVVGTGSTAFAGDYPPTLGPPGPLDHVAFDLATVFGDMLHATATGGSGLIDIVP